MKEQIQEAAKNKVFSESEVEELVRKAGSSIDKLRDAVKQHITHSKTINQLGAIYKYLQDFPSLNTLKANIKKSEREAADKIKTSVQEDVKVDVKASDQTIKKVEDIAKKTDQDIEIMEEGLTVGALKKMLAEAKTPSPKEIHKDKRFLSEDDKSAMRESLLTESEKKKSLNETNQVYFDTYAGAVQYARLDVEMHGFEISDDEWANKVNFGPKKPSEGETVKLNLQLSKDDKLTNSWVHIQVYNTGSTTKPYELNFYKTISKKKIVTEGVVNLTYDLNSKQFYKLIEYLESDISLFDIHDQEHYAEETGVDVPDLMDEYAMYGYTANGRSNSKIDPLISNYCKRVKKTWEEIEREANPPRQRNFEVKANNYREAQAIKKTLTNLGFKCYVQSAGGDVWVEGNPNDNSIPKDIREKII